MTQITPEITELYTIVGNQDFSPKDIPQEHVPNIRHWIQHDVIVKKQRRTRNQQAVYSISEKYLKTLWLNEILENPSLIIDQELDTISTYDLAKLTGVTYNTVRRKLQKLKEEQLITSTDARDP